MAELINSVLRATAILDLLGQVPDGMHLSEIARRLDLPKASTYRVLATLASQGYTKKDPENSKYYLGVKILRLQGNIAMRSNLVPIAIPHMNRLVLKLHETVHLAVLDEDRVVYLESRRPEHAFSSSPTVGRIAPVYCTALGKTLLAYSPPEQAGSVISEINFEPQTPNTILDIETLRGELERIRHRGYATDNEEQYIGVRCIAAPIRDHRNIVVAALSISAPTGRLPEDQDEVIAQEICATCRGISEALGANVT